MCQFGERRLVWNIEQVQMTCVGLQIEEEGGGGGGGSDREEDREEEK